jgi:hypothetical protein
MMAVKSLVIVMPQNILNLLGLLSKKMTILNVRISYVQITHKNTIKSDTLSLQPSDKGESAAWLVHKRPSSIDRTADMD